MSQRASSAGELAVRILGSRRQGRVTRVFQRSAYLRSGSDFLLLLWGGLRSPMTVNVAWGAKSETRLRVGEGCVFSHEGIRIGEVSVDVRGAALFRSSLRERRAVFLPSTKDLARGVAAARSLYDVSASGPTLAGDRVLKDFVLEAVEPLAAGRREAVRRPESYLPLIGRGGGFTPAGDDFVGGFTAAYNYFARCKGEKQISIPRKLLFSGTIPESAAMLGYSARGYVDEILERLILHSLGGERFLDDLMTLAHRGHTSGIDMSLGALLSVAAISDMELGGNALRECSAAFWNP